MFEDELHARTGRSTLWVLTRPLVWNGAQRIVVPEGFPTDLASVPAPFRALLNPNGPSKRPAVIHDYVYWAWLMDRLAADRLFALALAAEGVHPAIRSLYFAGVRVGGWRPWNRYRKEKLS